MTVLENETQNAGMYHSELNVKNLADGMYYVSLEFDKQKMVRKLIVTH